MRDSHMITERRTCRTYRVVQLFMYEGRWIVSKPLYEAKAELFRALSHPVRIRVLELLSVRDHAVHELLAEIPIEASSLSQQLAVLRRTGLVRQQRVRGEVVYSIVVPQTRDLLLAARLVLREVLADQAGLERELQPTGRDQKTGPDR
jgi:DNA-binding transcriptional ArsR family regulator